MRSCRMHWGLTGLEVRSEVVDVAELPGGVDDGDVLRLGGR